MVIIGQEILKIKEESTRKKLFKNAVVFDNDFFFNEILINGES